MQTAYDNKLYTKGSYVCKPSITGRIGHKVIFLREVKLLWSQSFSITEELKLPYYLPIVFREPRFMPFQRALAQSETHSGSGFKLRSPIPFPTTKTIMSSVPLIYVYPTPPLMSVFKWKKRLFEFWDFLLDWLPKKRLKNSVCHTTYPCNKWIHAFLYWCIKDECVWLGRQCMTKKKINFIKIIFLSFIYVSVKRIF